MALEHFAIFLEELEVTWVKGDLKILAGTATTVSHFLIKHWRKVDRWIKLVDFKAASRLHDKMYNFKETKLNHIKLFFLIKTAF